MAIDEVRLAINQGVVAAQFLQAVDLGEPLRGGLSLARSSNTSISQPLKWSEIAAYTQPRFSDSSLQISPASTFERDKAVIARINALKDAAIDEGIEWIGKSESGLLAFLKLVPLAKKPSVVLSDTGELRAMWENGRQEQIGLRFKASGDVQYVLFRGRANAPLARSSGVDDPKRVRQYIVTLGLSRLMEP